MPCIEQAGNYQAFRFLSHVRNFPELANTRAIFHEIDKEMNLGVSLLTNPPPPQINLSH